MNITDQTDKKPTVNSSDTKAMQEEYVKGVTIDQLAAKYGYSAPDVEAAVVTPAAPAAPLFQTDDNPANNPLKKAK